MIKSSFLGWLYSKTGNYNTSFYAIGAVEIFGGLLVSFIPLARKYFIKQTLKLDSECEVIEIDTGDNFWNHPILIRMNGQVRRNRTSSTEQPFLMILVMKLSNKISSKAILESLITITHFSFFLEGWKGVLHFFNVLSLFVFKLV